MFRKINKLIPAFEKWDFNKLFVNKNLYNYINNKVYNEVRLQQRLIRSPKIPYHKQWESRDFYRKNAK